MPLVLNGIADHIIIKSLLSFASRMDTKYLGVRTLFPHTSQHIHSTFIACSTRRSRKLILDPDP